jgi:hypothetical protein
LVYLFGVYYVDGHIITPQKGTEFKNILYEGDHLPEDRSKTTL